MVMSYWSISVLRGTLISILQIEELRFSRFKSQLFHHRFEVVAVYLFSVSVMSSAFLRPTLLYCCFRCIMLSTTHWVLSIRKAIHWKQWNLWFGPEKKERLFCYRALLNDMFICLLVLVSYLAIVNVLFLPKAMRYIVPD